MFNNYLYRKPPSLNSPFLQATSISSDIVFISSRIDKYPGYNCILGTRKPFLSLLSSMWSITSPMISTLNQGQESHADFLSPECNQQAH